MRWTKNGYGTFGALEVTAITIVAFAIVIGYVAIGTVASGLLIFFIVVAALASLCIMGIAVFSLLATKMRYFDEYKGCNGDFDGFLSIWNAIDSYMYAVDSLFCSDACPCYLNDTTSVYYSSNSSTAPYYNLWTTSDKTSSPIRFQDCKDEVIGQAKAEYYITNAYFNNTFNDKKFYDYFANIEKKFKCTGFCGTNYFNGKTQTNQKIVKYLFSDISEQGIPEHFGCFPFIIGWLRRTLNAIAGLGIVLFVVLIICIIAAVLLLLKSGVDEDEDEEQKPRTYVKPPVREPSEPSEKPAEPEPPKPKFREKIEKEPKEAHLDADTQYKQLDTSYQPNDEQKNEKDFIFAPSGSKQ